MPDGHTLARMLRAGNGLVPHTHTPGALVR
jgi:hypothetical protein